MQFFIPNSVIYIQLYLLYLQGNKLCVKTLEIQQEKYKYMAAKTDNFQSPDYFNIDDLLTEEHKLIRESVRS